MEVPEGRGEGRFVREKNEHGTLELGNIPGPAGILPAFGGGVPGRRGDIPEGGVDILPPLRTRCAAGYKMPRGITLTRDSQTPSVSISIVRAKARARARARASRVRAVTLTLTARGATCWKMPIGARG